MTDRNRFLQVEPCRVPTSLHTTMGHAQRPSMYRLNHRKMWMSSRQLLFEGFHRRLLNFALELCLQLRSILKRQIFDKHDNKYLEMLYDRKLQRNLRVCIWLKLIIQMMFVTNGMPLKVRMCIFE